jgi:hypothetical protein
MVQDHNNEGSIENYETSPKLDRNQQSQINELLGRWNLVQGRLKRAEQISQFALVPAINELRYAGRMLVAALANPSPSEENGIPTINDAIVTASQYITNAEHDISDALIYFYQKKADDLNHRYGAETIRKRYPDYANLLLNLKKARTLVISSRGDVSKRKENYEKLADITKNISEHYFALVDAEVLFGLDVDHFKSRIKLWKFMFGAVLIWAVLSTTAIIFL